MLEGITHHHNNAPEAVADDVVAAARDPNSAVGADQVQHTVLNQAQSAGAAAFELNPNASPEERAAQFKAKTAQTRPHRPHQVAALVSDQDGDGVPDYDLPPPSKEGAIAAADLTTEVNGEIVTNDEVDKYGRVGWAPRFGNPGDKLEDEGTMLDHQTFLEGKLDDKFFGDWYHNAGVIIFACLASWTVAVLGGGLGWVFIVMAVCGTYYRTSLRRVRRNFRDDIIRQLAMTKLETDTESLDWINNFMLKFWPIYAPILCETVIQSVDQVLSTSTPAFLDSMNMSFFTLGTKPPRMEHVKTYPREEDDIVMMDWKFSFTPNDIADLTARQVKNKVNPKVILEVRIGKAMISKALKIIVEDMACSGIMRVKMKLQLEYPFVDRVEICFLERPTFDYACKPLGGESLGFDINFVPGLEGFIQEQIHANLAPMMYAPNVFPIEIAKLLAGSPVDQAIGVLQVQFHGAQGLKNPDKFSGTPDPYATLSINNREVLGKTKTVEQNANPRWNETVNIILTSLREPLTMHVYDYNEFRKDKELGVCTFDLGQLEKETTFENMQLEVLASGRARGVLQADIRYFPVLEGQKLADGTMTPPPESATGIVKFTVEQAKELDGSKSLVGALNPYAVLLLNGKEIQVSKKKNRTNNPIWPDATKEMLITDKKTAKLGLVIKDDRDLGSDPVLGTYQIRLDDMIDLMGKGQEWYSLAGARTGRAKMMLQWKPVALTGALGGSGGYVTPVGVLRFHFQSGRDLKNLDTVGKSDPYVRVLLSGIQKGRTVTWKNNLNPDWDEVCYVPIHSEREKLTIEVMDEENTQKDRTMGQMEVAASEYVQLGEDGQYIVRDTKNKVISGAVRIGNNQPKGTINFTIAFYPCLNVTDPEEEERADAKAASSVEAPATPSVSVTPTTPRHERSQTVTSVATAKTTSSQQELRNVLEAGEKEQTETDDVKTAAVPKIRIGPEDLAKYESGLLVYKIIDGQLAHPGTFLEILIDDNLFPAHTSAKAKGQHYNFNETGDVMVRELDLSRLTLRLVSEVNRKGEAKEDPIRAKLVGPTLDTLRRCLYTPTQIALRDSSGRESKITVSMRFLPVQMQLDPSESFNNAGTLRIDVLDAADLPSADRNGKSDPFCKFSLHGEEIYKTKVQKKTLNPAWNEVFETSVRSRTAGQFVVNVMDWDFADSADFLGKAAIDLNSLEPFTPKTVTLPLDGKSGSLRLKMLFKPDYVLRSRQGSSTFSGTFAAPGKVIGAPVKGVGKGAVMVGGGVAKGASFLGRGFKRRTVSGMEVPDEDGANGNEVESARVTSMDSSSAIPTITNGHAPQPSIDGMAEPAALGTSMHQRQVSTGMQSTMPAETGTATITVLSASGFEGDPKLEVHILQDGPRGSKDVMKTDHKKAKAGAVEYTNETKRLQCAADAQFKIQVKDHKTFGSDSLGEAPFFLNDSSRSGGEQEVKVGSGVVVLQTSFQASDAASMLRPVTAVGNAGAEGASESPAGSAKKGGLNRFMTRRERSVTPSGPS
ncbi:hypothetical protein LTR62_001400 [Meristemomyces frigidus]|uniref:Tricalbin n=1 Tax=Meristemomyces frigidus TaxID=1508187 RepID=A0AAN7YL24_9PEZI|nr:hypothetical protein LTR62_001400 [Meristemomyces frigidus]